MRVVKVATLRATVVGAVFVLVAAGASWATAVPLPEQDSFYAEPEGLAGSANGTVLASRVIETESFGQPLPADAWQVRYKPIGNPGDRKRVVTGKSVSVRVDLGCRRV